ncbi:hypothetical protein C8R44DRAFT_947576 [Mycena epipterygia]|nr:hypothetical protein C8R44DRAFT_947576 [Mycena epipterygia]
MQDSRGKRNAQNTVPATIISTGPSAGLMRSLFSAFSCAEQGARLAEEDEAPQRPNIDHDATGAGGSAASVAVLTFTPAYAGADEPDELGIERPTTQSPDTEVLVRRRERGRGKLGEGDSRKRMCEAEENVRVRVEDPHSSPAVALPVCTPLPTAPSLSLFCIRRRLPRARLAQRKQPCRLAHEPTLHAQRGLEERADAEVEEVKWCAVRLKRRAHSADLKMSGRLWGSKSGCLNRHAKGKMSRTSNLREECKGIVLVPPLVVLVRATKERAKKMVKVMELGFNHKNEIGPASEDPIHRPLGFTRLCGVADDIGATSDNYGQLASEQPKLQTLVVDKSLGRGVPDGSSPFWTQASHTVDVRHRLNDTP